jgi:hypothetical protein
MSYNHFTPSERIQLYQLRITEKRSMGAIARITTSENKTGPDSLVVLAKRYLAHPTIISRTICRNALRLALRPSVCDRPIACSTN